MIAGSLWRDRASRSGAVECGDQGSAAAVLDLQRARQTRGKVGVCPELGWLKVAEGPLYLVLAR
jgi:hypothetical protein